MCPRDVAMRGARGSQIRPAAEALEERRGGLDPAAATGAAPRQHAGEATHPRMQQHILPECCKTNTMCMHRSSLAVLHGRTHWQAAADIVRARHAVLRWAGATPSSSSCPRRTMASERFWYRGIAAGTRCCPGSPLCPDELCYVFV